MDRQLFYIRLEQVIKGTNLIFNAQKTNRMSLKTINKDL